MTDNIDQCCVDGCGETGFIIVDIDDRMLCTDHFSKDYDISYLNEPEKGDE